MEQKTPDEELAIALERCISQWKAKPSNHITEYLIKSGEKLVQEFKASGQFASNRRVEAKQLVDLANQRIIQSQS